MNQVQRALMYSLFDIFATIL